MAVEISDKLGWVRSHPALSLALACSVLVLFLIPQVMRVFMFFSPLLASTALVLVTAILNVGTSSSPCRGHSDDSNGEDENQAMYPIGSADKLEYNTSVLFERIFKADVRQSCMAAKEMMLEEMLNADRNGEVPLKEAEEVCEVTTIKLQEGGSKLEIKVAEHLISCINNVDMGYQMVDVEKEDSNDDTLRVINATDDIDVATRNNVDAVDYWDPKIASVSVHKIYQGC